MLLTIILWVVGALVGLVALFAIFAAVYGAMQPATHTASRSLTLKQSPETLWNVITDFANEPSWQAHVERVTRLPDIDGKEAWEHKHKGSGNPPMTLVTTEKIPPKRLVRTIDDSKKVFSGRWEFDLSPADGGTKITITENGQIPNPFFRGMFRLFASPHMYIDKYLTALAAKFNEPANIS